MLGSAVLVLNQDYLPLHVCTARRAVVLVWLGKAEILENGRGEFRTPSAVAPVPSVIRLHYLVHRPFLQRRLTRREIFLRDHYTCQYCGRQTRDLTLDHVIPRRQGGQHTWENIVSACRACNHRKAGRTPEEGGMKPLHFPHRPRPSPYFVHAYQFQENSQWQKYFPPLRLKPAIPAQPPL